MLSEKNEIKTRRYWRPNVQLKRLWSEALQAYIRLRITTRVLRTVDKVGGLDEYLLGEKAGRIKELGMGGWKLRWRIMQTEAVKERFRKQRELMGLPPKEEVLQGSDGMLATVEQVEDEIKQFDEALQKGQDVDIGEEVEEEMSVDEGFMSEEPPSREKVLL
jgi:large subunit ribosomal protein L28